MNRPQERRFNLDHPHTQMRMRRAQRRFERQTGYADVGAWHAAMLAMEARAPAVTREQYEATQATLPVADRIPW